MTDICKNCGADCEKDFCDYICQGYYMTSLGDATATFESDARALAREVIRFCQDLKNPGGSDRQVREALALIEDLADSVIAWEESEDPYVMGWVDDRGRP